MWKVAVCSSLLLSSSAPRADAPKAPYELILEASDAVPQDSAVQKGALARIDAEIAKDRGLALSHYVRGRILSRLGRDADAVEAYDEALRRDKKLADALYNSGVVLGRMGRLKEAAQRFDQALEMNPRAGDAAYNAGQAYYDLADFALALARFRRAHEVAPADFNAAKKLMQAQLALGREKEAWKTRDDVLKIWKTSRDPAVRRLTEYVLDQFVVGGAHVLAYETLAPAEDLAYVYTFRVFGEGDKVIGSVQLETSAVIREGGVPYLMGVSRGGRHEQAGIAYKTLPKYSEVKETAKKLIVARLKP